MLFQPDRHDGNGPEATDRVDAELVRHSKQGDHTRMNKVLTKKPRRLLRSQGGR